MYEEKKNKALNQLNKVDEKLKEAEIILSERSTYLKELKKDRDQAFQSFITHYECCNYKSILFKEIVGLIYSM